MVLVEASKYTLYSLSLQIFAVDMDILNFFKFFILFSILFKFNYIADFSPPTFFLSLHNKGWAPFSAVKGCAHIENELKPTRTIIEVRYIPVILGEKRGWCYKAVLNRVLCCRLYLKKSVQNANRRYSRCGIIDHSSWRLGVDWLVKDNTNRSVLWLGYICFQKLSPQSPFKSLQAIRTFYIACMVICLSDYISSTHNSIV